MSEYQDWVCVCGWKSSEHPGKMHDDTDLLHRVLIPLVQRVAVLEQAVVALRDRTAPLQRYGSTKEQLLQRHQGSREAEYRLEDGSDALEVGLTYLREKLCKGDAQSNTLIGEEKAGE